MPLIRANEPLGPRPVILLIYGDPGIGKTSLINTAKSPLTIDGDRGISRSIFRKDAIVPENWEEVLKHEKEGLFKNYATIGIDTPKAILDDFLMSYVIRQDPKLRGNKLWAYGAIGDEFKLFANNRREDQADLLMICHSKKDEDVKRMIPDVTGQSFQLLLRIADMIGYYTIISGRRMLSFDPTDSTVGKNVARLAPIEVPDSTDPKFRTFMADVIETVRVAIQSQSEEQLEATKKSAEIQQQIDGVDSPDTLTDILIRVKELPKYLMIPLTHKISEKAKELGYVPNTQTKRYELPAGSAAPAPAAAPAAAPIPVAEPSPIPDTPYDNRVVALASAGLSMMIDQAEGYGITLTYDQIAEMPEKEYMETVARVIEAKKTPKAPPRKRPAALNSQPH